jgi:hypothetical protein
VFSRLSAQGTRVLQIESLATYAPELRSYETTIRTRKDVCKLDDNEPQDHVPQRAANADRLVIWRNSRLAFRLHRSLLIGLILGHMTERTKQEFCPQPPGMAVWPFRNVTQS